MHACPVCNEIPEHARIEGDHHHNLEYRIPGRLVSEMYIVIQDKVYGTMDDAMRDTCRVFQMHPAKAAEYIRTMKSFTTRRV